MLPGGGYIAELLSRLIACGTSLGSYATNGADPLPRAIKEKRTPPRAKARGRRSVGFPLKRLVAPLLRFQARSDRDTECSHGENGIAHRACDIVLIRERTHCSVDAIPCGLHGARVILELRLGGFGAGKVALQARREQTPGALHFATRHHRKRERGDGVDGADDEEGSP